MTFAHVELDLDVVGDDPVELLGIVGGRLGLAPIDPRLLRSGPLGDDFAPEQDRLRFGVRRVVGDAAHAGVHVGAAEGVRVDDLAGRGLHERRPAEEDAAVPAHDDRVVRERRDVGAARGAVAEDEESWGTPICDNTDWLRKMRPAETRSGKSSDCSGRKARRAVAQVDDGRRFSIAMSEARARSS
jgi:hypothetical protein